MMVSLSLRLVQRRRSGIWVHWVIPACAYARRPFLSPSKTASFPLLYHTFRLTTSGSKVYPGGPLIHPDHPLPYSGGLPVYLQARVLTHPTPSLSVPNFVPRPHRQH
jgi:hypothetical protein